MVNPSLGDWNTMSVRQILLLLIFASSSLEAGQLRGDGDMVVKAEPSVLGTVSSGELTVISDDANLTAWIQLAKGQALNPLEESWSAIYSPKDKVGVAGNWRVQLTQARSLAARATHPNQKRWLNLFIRACEAVERRDAPRFSSALCGLEVHRTLDSTALVPERKFFTAK